SISTAVIFTLPPDRGGARFGISENQFRLKCSSPIRIEANAPANEDVSVLIPCSSRAHPVLIPCSSRVSDPERHRGTRTARTGTGPGITHGAITHGDITHGDIT